MKKISLSNRHLAVTLLVGTLFVCTPRTEAAWTTLDHPLMTQTIAYDIDGSNIVGWCYDGSEHGFLYDGITWTTLDFPEATVTRAYGIDGSSIVGYYHDLNPPIKSGAFLYDGITWTTLDFPGAGLTVAEGIDGSNIVGWYVYEGGEHGFLYDGITWTTLDFPGAIGTRAQGIDGSNIVGWYLDAGGYHGFLYDGSTWTTLDFPGVDGSTMVYSIDGSNIVGGYDCGSIYYYGFLYDGSTWTTLNFPGATVTVAWGVDGSNIVGRGETWATQSHGFLYTLNAYLSGWVWMDGSSDFGYSLDEGDLLYFYSSEPVWNYNFTTGLWDTEGPVDWTYIDWPFIYELDTDTLWFALPPESGLWVYHFSNNQWEWLPRIIP